MAKGSAKAHQPQHGHAGRRRSEPACVGLFRTGDLVCLNPDGTSVWHRTLSGTTAPTAQPRLRFFADAAGRSALRRHDVGSSASYLLAVDARTDAISGRWTGTSARAEGRIRIPVRCSSRDAATPTWSGRRGGRHGAYGPPPARSLPGSSKRCSTSRIPTDEPSRRRTASGVLVIAVASDFQNRGYPSRSGPGQQRVTTTHHRAWTFSNSPGARPRWFQNGLLFCIRDDRISIRMV